METQKQYWRANLRYLVILLALWFIFGLGASVLWTDLLNGVKIAGFPLGFWFSMQGSVIVFVILLFVYMYLMNRLDEKYGMEEE